MIYNDNMDERTRRRELADFLKTRRARLSAVEAGFYTNSRRRTPGLRREELAELADVGITWYTWLEQAREIQVSIQVIGRIAAALQLTPIEKQHLFRLAKQPLTEDIEQPKIIGCALRHLLDDLETTPAFVTGRLWRIIAWNRAAAALFGDFGDLPEDERNLLRFAFTNEKTREIFVGWEDFAQTVLARFRRSCGHHYQADPEAVRLIESLKKESPEFNEYWSNYDLRDGLAHTHREINHPQIGSLMLEETALQIGDASDFQLTTYAPTAEPKTLSKLRRLVETFDIIQRTD